MKGREATPQSPALELMMVALTLLLLLAAVL